MKITLTMDAQQVEVVLQGLGELPLKQALSVFAEIRKQAEEQMQQEKPGGALSDQQ